MTLAVAAGLVLCPVCRAPLTLNGPAVWLPTPPVTAARCPIGHCFDVARAGYLNLLGQAPPAHADTSVQVAARRRSQASGAYAALAEVLAEHCAGPVLLEAGAGAAYYIAHCLEADPDRIGLALDISTAAAKVAARAHPRLAALVADVWRPLPVPDGAITTLIDVFAPRHLSEFARVLAPGGRLLVVVPNPGHLGELRAAYDLLGIHPEKVAGLIESAPPALRLVAVEPIRYTWPASADLVRDLIVMGPNGFYPLAAPVAATTVTIDVMALVWVKADAAGS